MKLTDKKQHVSPFKLMTKLDKQGAIASIVCSLCNVFGLITLLYVVPDLYDLPEGRLRIINQYGSLLYLWYFIVFALVGICVFFINSALLQNNKKSPSVLTIATTLSAYLSVSYLLIICTIEVLSNEFFLAEYMNTEVKRNQLTNQIYSVLISLRSYTEWTLDLWLILVNISLFKEQRFTPYIHVFGILTGILGVLILHPNLQALAYYYVAATSIWFMAIGLLFFKAQGQRVE